MYRLNGGRKVEKRDRRLGRDKKDDVTLVLIEILYIYVHTQRELFSMR